MDSDTLALFATKVQPVLMNACAGCHTGKRGGGFDLIRTHGTGIGDRRSLDYNLSAVAAHLDPRDPARSKILSKARTLHAKGMTGPPLQGKHKSGALLLLEAWVRKAVASNPSFQPAPAGTPVPPPTAVAATPAPPSVFGAGRPVSKPQPAALPQPASDEPASPAAFNQQYHGEKPGK